MGRIYTRTSVLPVVRRAEDPTAALAWLKQYEGDRNAALDVPGFNWSAWFGGPQMPPVPGIVLAAQAGMVGNTAPLDASGHVCPRQNGHRAARA